MLSVPELKSQKGQTVLLIIGLIAVVGAVGLEVRHRQAQKKQSLRQAALREHTGLIMQNFASRLQNPESCTDALAGEIVVPGSSANVAIRFVIDESLDPKAKALGAGSKVVLGLRLAGLKIEVPAVEDMRTEILDSNGVATPLVRYPAQLQAEFTDDSGVEIAQNRSTGIPFYVWAKPFDGQILSCFGRNSAAVLCNDLGGYFMPNTKPYHLSCRQSFKTERRLASGLVPRGTCRVAGLQAKASACSKRLDSQFAGNLMQQGHSRFSPELPNQYLCELCQ